MANAPGALEQILLDLFTVKGRLSRRKYGFYILFYLLPYLMPLILEITGFGRLTNQIGENTITAFLGLWALITFPSFTLIIIKRLHDVGLGGANMIPAFVLNLGIKYLWDKGDKGPNKYGPDPLEKHKT